MIIFNFSNKNKDNIAKNNILSIKILFVGYR